jgi:hypothetical protein
MKRSIVILAVALGAAAVAASVWAQTPGETPFPSPSVKSIFVSSQTVTGPGDPLGAGVLTNFFPRGSTVVFRAFAGQNKTGKVLTKEDVKYFYVQIPGQPNVKLAYTGQFKPNDAASRFPWTATWRIPATFPLGIVNFKVQLQTKSKSYGSFVQIPVATSQLTVTTP